MPGQDISRKELYDALDDVEDTTKQVTDDQSRKARAGQAAIIDGVNEMRHTVGTIPQPGEKPPTEEIEDAG